MKNSGARSANFVHRLLLADIRKQIIASYINKFKFIKYLYSLQQIGAKFRNQDILMSFTATKTER